MIFLLFNIDAARHGIQAKSVPLALKVCCKKANSTDNEDIVQSVLSDLMGQFVISSVL